jgi:hypothetical protein
MATYYHTTILRSRSGELVLVPVGSTRANAEKAARTYRRNTGTETRLLLRCDLGFGQTDGPDSYRNSGLHYRVLLSLPVPFRGHRKTAAP